MKWATSIRVRWRTIATALFTAVILITSYSPCHTLYVLQRISGIIQDECTIGNAIVAIPRDWIVVRQSDGGGARIRYFGFLPRYFDSSHPIVPDPSITFSSCRNKTQMIMLSEPRDEIVAKAQQALDCSPAEANVRHFGSWKGLMTEANEVTTIMVPELRLSVSVTHVERLGDLRISKRPDAH